MKHKSKYDIEVDPLTKRKCRKCSSPLRASRYFTCVPCDPELSSLDDDFIYIEEATRWGSEDELLLPEGEDDFFTEEDDEWDDEHVEE